MAILSSVLLSACSVFGVRGVEEPRYSVAAKLGEVEIRRYAERLAAETVVSADEVGARSAGFQLLAGYIFGANRTQAKIAMTAPVDQSPEKIVMTAPVDQAPAAPGQWRIRFFMPARYTRETLPEPTDARVRIVSVPAETIAVARYAGSTSADAVATANAALLRALDGSAYRPEGAPMAWFYDPPWTLPPFRRNEAAMRVNQ